MRTKYLSVLFTLLVISTLVTTLKDQNCMIFSDKQKSSCSECQKGYFKKANSLGNIKCLPCQAHCKECKGANGSSCVSCYPGFYVIWDRGTCLRCPDGCSNCFDQTTCFTCEKGYYKYNKICFRNSSFRWNISFGVIISTCFVSFFVFLVCRCRMDGSDGTKFNRITESNKGYVLRDDDLSISEEKIPNLPKTKKKLLGRKRNSGETEDLSWVDNLTASSTVFSGSQTIDEMEFGSKRERKAL